MTPLRNRGRSRDTGLAKTLCLLIAAALLIGASALPRPALAGDIPTFAVDAAWPKPLPNNWILGQVGGSPSTGWATSG
jgi:hypothetical protein